MSDTIIFWVELPLGTWKYLYEPYFRYTIVLQQIHVCLATDTTTCDIGVVGHFQSIVPMSYFALFTNQYLYLFSILLTFTEIILLHKCAKQSEESQKEIKEVGNCSVVISPDVNRFTKRWHSLRILSNLISFMRLIQYFF